MQLIKIPTLDICRVSVSPSHTLTHTAYHILRDPSHVLYAPTRQRYKHIVERPYNEGKEGLWMVFSGNAMPRKRVVRSWARRRIDHAVAEALRMRGFDRSGKRLVDGGVTTMGKVRSRGVSHEQTTPCIQDSLVGTVDVQILNPSVEANFKEVQRQAGLVVEEILRVCGGHNHNRNLDFFRSQKC